MKGRAANLAVFAHIQKSLRFYVSARNLFQYGNLFGYICGALLTPVDNRPDAIVDVPMDRFCKRMVRSLILSKMMAGEFFEI